VKPRRLITIPVLVALTLLLTLLAPMVLVVALLLTPLPGFRGAVPTLGFILGYLWCETIGVVAAFWIWLRHHDAEAFQSANFALQCWWGSALKAVAERLYRLRFEVEGASALDGPAALMLPRHASIADTIIPVVFYAKPRNVRLRYVLKKELLFDPCLDIVGHRLPNYFVDRGGEDSEGARRGVAALLGGMSEREGALIYPEGTRFSPAKHAALRRRYADTPDMQAQLVRWTEVLPPRLGGTLAMLQANPGRDLLFCAHTGFEGSSRFSDLINGSWVRARIRIRFWRVRYSDVPHGADGQKRLLFEQWDRMQAAVVELQGS